MPKHVAELTLQLVPQLSSIGSIWLPVWMVLLPVSTVLLLVMPVVASSKTVATILGREEPLDTTTIMSSFALLGGRTSVIKNTRWATKAKGSCVGVGSNGTVVGLNGRELRCKNS